MKLEIRPRARAAVSKVLLVGGATRMPGIVSFLRNMTGLEPVGADGGVDPDEAVALGAAVQAGILQGQVDGLMVMEQWQASLMRSLATLTLRNDAAAAAAVADRYDIDEMSQAEAGVDDGPPVGQQQRGERRRRSSRRSGGDDGAANDPG